VPSNRVTARVISLPYDRLACYPWILIVTPPKLASTVGKAPASTGTASKLPTNTAEGSKAAKKTSKTEAVAAAGDHFKKRRKVRKETYSSYICKGV
jgi:hypothetical protein